jgi:hypothetical protein
MKNSINNLLLALGVAVVAAAPALAQSTTFVMTNNFSGDGTVNITTNGGTTWEDVYAGTYTGTLNGTTYNIFCVDPAHEINGGQQYTADTSENITSPSGTLQTAGTYKGYYNGGLASAMTPTDLAPDNLGTVSASQRSSEVAYLADDFLNATTSTFTGQSGSTSLSSNETAVQLAIWDIITDGGNGLGTGEFEVDSTGLSQYGSLTNYYEGLASQNESYSSSDAFWIQSPTANGTHYQDFVAIGGGALHPNGFEGPGVVPEPNVSAFVLSMLLAVGIMFFLKKKNKVTA